MNIKFGLLFGLLFCLLAAGCKTSVLESDRTPPFAPRGIATETGDGLVILSWIANPEPDVAAYKIYVSDSYDGVYQVIGQTTGTMFTDNDATNGVTVYYAVSAVDDEGNESDLSTDVAYDTPRPEGFSVGLPSYLSDPVRAGYDFSSVTVGPYNDEFTDLFFESSGGEHLLVVWEDTDIQDMGYTESLYELQSAPTGGWSPTKDVRVIAGHTYVVRTWDNHYAKVRVRTVSASIVTFDWAYQLQAGNRRLKEQAERGVLRPGPGFSARGGR